ncbi:MAG TPA: hypothetical protein VK841_13355 [Polyangiaceae bacterium]|nr:hypothetical protein [Polyangiaceae bacterium]
MNIDPDATGQTFFTNPIEGFEFGSNSEVDASIQAKAINFQIPIATATIIGRVSRTCRTPARFPRAARFPGIASRA